ncbi:MAG: hypothetical protein KatS3mg068_2287 [Candidatus Sericytochromatia bacterium]|nr:MAG: hypothetical protein KatS3mg068_2287 [Candidatus Sericytochromatia bacterium]
MKKTLFLMSLIFLSNTSFAYADSLWNDTSVASWFTDRRPTFVIGGLVTINVQERTQATTNATLQGNKVLQNVHKWEIPAMKPAEGLFNRQLKN